MRVCRECGGKLGSLDSRPAGGVAVEVTRRRYRCKACGAQLTTYETDIDTGEAIVMSRRGTKQRRVHRAPVVEVRSGVWREVASVVPRCGYRHGLGGDCEHCAEVVR